MQLNKSFIKIRNIFYDHWKMAFPYVLPSIGIALLYFWDKFRDLMTMMIPFWILFIFLLFSGCLITITLILVNKIKALQNKLYPRVEETTLVNNLIYKLNDPTQAFCPFCFERGEGFKRMKRYYSENKATYYYDCFICNYKEEVPLNEEKNPI